MASAVCFLKSFSAICSVAASFFENVKHVTVEKNIVHILYLPIIDVHLCL